MRHGLDWVGPPVFKHGFDLHVVWVLLIAQAIGDEDLDSLQIDEELDNLGEICNILLIVKPSD